MAQIDIRARNLKISGFGLTFADFEICNRGKETVPEGDLIGVARFSDRQIARVEASLCEPLRPGQSRAISIIIDGGGGSKPNLVSISRFKPLQDYPSSPLAAPSRFRLKWHLLYIATYTRDLRKGLQVG